MSQGTYDRHVTVLSENYAATSLTARWLSFCYTARMPPSPDQIDRERIGTVKRTHERAVLKSAFEEAKARYEIALTSSLTDRSTEIAKYDLDIAQMNLELFESEHDPTGAWKGDRFGGDIAKMFEHDFIQEDHGMLVPTEELQQTHLLTISMNELDRLNKEGGHALGDEGMSMTYKEIASKVEATLHGMHPDLTPEELASNYDIYRTGGNEFSVVVRKVLTPFAMQELAAHFAAVDAVSEKYEGIEAPTLAANHASMSKVYEILNSLRHEDGIEDFKTWSNKDKTNLAVDVVKETLKSDNDVRKTLLRLNRLEELLRSDDEPKARAFYDNYLKKALGTLLSDNPEEPADFDAAKATFSQMGALDESWAIQWGEQKSQIAIDEGCKLLRHKGEEARSGEANLQAATVQKIKQRYFESMPKYGPRQKNEAEFVAPLATEGLKILLNKQQQAEEAQKAYEQDPGVIEGKKAEVVDLDYRIEAARRDTLTGLELRGVLFADMEDAIKRNESMSTLFIDMAFLKYFDKVGGSSVGDMAIKKAAEILDTVTRDPEIKEKYPNAKIKAYRYAGDEFVVSVEGSVSGIAEELQNLILQKAESAGSVPSSVSKNPAYTPERISFNIGTSYAESASSLESQVVDLGLPLHGEPGSPERVNHLAEYAIRFADKEIEITKAMDRYELLIALILGRGENDPHVEQMMIYSQKAIAGKEGEALVRGWAQSLMAAQPSEYAAINKAANLDLLDFTLRMQEKALEQKNERDQAIERRIENHIRSQYLERRIEQLQSRLSSLEEKLQQAQEMNEKDRKNHDREIALYKEELEELQNIKQQFT